ncbi:hypothetical protein C5167_012696 [Papaver somniferum]|uniref:Leucine-rich repeat-containing N-terminal plant-type domain-containing protein n=1 Tax=Papaver somniferum TaxID=3469 RepID=A0A4Y7IZ06_PAPSO|nr:hypothetical protein C5167_012696 [Papaver somniferum]
MGSYDPPPKVDDHKDFKRYPSVNLDLFMFINLSRPTKLRHSLYTFSNSLQDFEALKSVHVSKMNYLPQQPNFNFSKAFIFLLFISVDVTCLVLVNDTKSSDRLALIAFKNEVTDPLGTLSSWNSSDNDYCKWRGVTCSRRHPSRVAVLNLASLGLLGSISPHIGNLSFLKTLNLHNNSLSGNNLVGFLD